MAVAPSSLKRLPESIQPGDSSEGVVEGFRVRQGGRHIRIQHDHVAPLAKPLRVPAPLTPEKSYSALISLTAGSAVQATRATTPQT